ncbi:MAG: PucR family transcriptional regulator ligand-binding domain-containing protein [Erysipelotrichales bacterium]
MITLKHLLQNPSLSSFRLQNDGANLDVKVSNVCILDYEFDENTNTKNIFYPDELILSSLQVAKNDEDIFYNIVKSLIDMKVSALAIKDIYFQSIPNKVKVLAQENNFPIFIFDRSLYYENIIVSIMQEIKEGESISLYQQYIDKIIAQSLNDDEGFRLLQLNKDDYYIFAIDGNYNFTNNDINSKLVNKVYNYHEFNIAFIKKDHDLEYYLKYFDDVLKDEYYIGYANTLNSLHGALKDSLNSLRAAQINNVRYVEDYQSSYYSFLIENIQQESFQSFMKTFLSPIVDDEMMLESLIVYVLNDFSIESSAKQLHVHENTLRYRIEKAQQLITKTSSRDDFKINLKLAITIYLDNQNKIK